MSRHCRLLPLIALLLAGCSAGERAEPDPFLVVSGPRAFFSLQLEDAAQEVVWRLVADPARPLEKLVYGRVPPGFRQEFPAGGLPPRRLIPGEALTLESIAANRKFLHRGHAEIGGRFSISDWEMRPTPVGPSTVAERGLGEPESALVDNSEEEVKR